MLPRKLAMGCAKDARKELWISAKRSFCYEVILGNAHVFPDVKGLEGVGHFFGGWVGAAGGVGGGVGGGGRGGGRGGLGGVGGGGWWVGGGGAGGRGAGGCADLRLNPKPVCSLVTISKLSPAELLLKHK